MRIIQQYFRSWQILRIQNWNFFLIESRIRVLLSSSHNKLRRLRNIFGIYSMENGHCYRLTSFYGVRVVERSTAPVQITLELLVRIAPGDFFRQNVSVWEEIASTYVHPLGYCGILVMKIVRSDIVTNYCNFFNIFCYFWYFSFV